MAKWAISYLQNTLYKLDSITLDKELFDNYINKIKDTVNEYINNDINIINLYGNINSIDNLLQSHNITYDMMNFYNLNSLQIFDLQHKQHYCRMSKTNYTMVEMNIKF